MKQKGYGGQTKPVFRKKAKTTKKLILKLESEKRKVFRVLPRAKTVVIDTAAPTVGTRAVDTTTLTITYGETLDSTKVPAASAFVSTVPIRSSLRRVRSWVSSTVLVRLSTFAFTPPTSVRTNFFVAHAGATATTRASSDALSTLFRIVTS